MINPMDLTNKHILITGASSGIGRATCILASQLGAKVSMVARNEEALRETESQMEGTGHKFYILDLSKVEEIEGLVKQIVAEQGAIDGFVHSAGIATNCPIALTKIQFLDSIMRVNFYAFAEFLRVLSGKKFSNANASFIGISSVVVQSGDKTQGAYSASKAAMNGFIHPVAKELAKRRIRLNTVAPGAIHTKIIDNDFIAIGGNEEDLIKRQYLGMGEPIDVANAICFLLSDAAKLITGTTLVVDGGFLS